MGSKWPVVRFDEVAENISRTFKFKGVDNVCFINTGDVSNGKFLHNQLSSVKNLPGQAKKSIVKGDVLFSEIRPGNGRFALVDFDDTELFVVSTKFMVIHVNNCLMDNGFLYLQLTSKETLNEFQRIAESRSGTFPQITFDAVSQHLFYCPELKEQQRIKEYIAVIDNKITLNRQINQTLEQMAQALFKSWFVDFDPVVDNALDAGFFEQELDLPDELLRRAEARKAVRAQVGFKPLPAATRQLFPAAFEPCAEPSLGLGGWVPKGWRIKKLENLMELVYGKALKSTERIEGPVPVYGSGGITGYHNESLVDGPSIIVGRKGTVGSLYWEDRPFFPIDTVFYVRSEKPLTYCFNLLQTLGLADMNTDAAVPGLNRNNAYRLQVITPDDDLLNAFDTFTTTLRKRVFVNAEQVTTLISLRDTLLPKLISGELSLDDVELTTQ